VTKGDTALSIPHHPLDLVQARMACRAEADRELGGEKQWLQLNWIWFVRRVIVIGGFASLTFGCRSRIGGRCIGIGDGGRRHVNSLNGSESR
jgi:hypothetical protein